MKTLFAVLMLCFLLAGASAQSRRDPLTSIEVDQMRDSAQDPKRRIELLLGFAHARLIAVEGLHLGANSDARNLAKTEELLGDFAALIDELDDNLDIYSNHREDLRAPLRRVLETEKGFEEMLKRIAEQIAQVQTHGPNAVGLGVALEDATESLRSSGESAGAMLAAADERKKGEASEKRAGPRP